MLLNRTTSYIFEPYVAQSNVNLHFIINADLHFTYRRREFYLHTLHLPCFSLRLDLVMFCVIITNIWWVFQIPTWLEDNLPSFQYSRLYFNISILQWEHLFERLEEAETHCLHLCYYDTILTQPEEQYLPFKQTETTTIFSFGYQSCTWPRSGPFYW